MKHGQQELFTNEEVARKYFEKMRWPDGPICPHCGLVGEAYELKGKSTRAGLYKCAGCRKPFTVKMRTIFEDSHIPLHKWFYAIHLMCSSKKGMSAYQFHRMTATFYGEKVSYRTAWFMFHRIRFAMTQHPMIDKLRGVVEVDETYIGGKEKGNPGRPTPARSKKRPVVALVDRERGKVRSFPVERVTLETIKPILKEHVEIGSTIQTDEAVVYHFMHEDFPNHDVVKHKDKEYSRREADGRHVTTNTVEGYFGLLKRGIYGTYHHVGVPYLQQYLNEFDFRYNNRKITDAERTDAAARACEGKRLTLRTPTRLQ
ncbi:MAG TPA: IS1595 family transposase [Terriglobales bacterium]|nr:IS1595 family transposase [Terriglobales bacterium]